MRRSTYLAVLGTVLLSAVVVGAGEAQTAISADGLIESTSGGFKFPNGTVQTTAVDAVGSAPVERTGQTECWDTNGNPRGCLGTGEDGEVQAGVAWPTPRFTDNGDGTVTDNLTGLNWLKDANCSGQKTWQGALGWIRDLNTTLITCTDYAAMTFTDWRLPNIKELLSLVDYSRDLLALPYPNPFVGVREWYWSSSSRAGSPDLAWVLETAFGLDVFAGFKDDADAVWPVRGVIRGPAPVEDTGQTACWATDGTPRACAGTGEDGELQAGVAWSTPRFTDNGNGTVADNLTGLNWLKDANCPGPKIWQGALDWIRDLNTTLITCTDYAAMTFTDWRLPNIKELLSLVDYSQTHPALPSGHPFVNVQSSAFGRFYWSSSADDGFPHGAWMLDTTSGASNTASKADPARSVWPVRGGQ